MKKENRILKKSGKLIYNPDTKEPCFCTTPFNEDHKDLLIGKSYSYTESCKNCKGTGKVPGMRGGKPIKRKCKDCGGDGYISLSEPKILGTCKRCDGTLFVKSCTTDHMTEDDRRLMFELIDFEDTYNHQNGESTFNEMYLGFNTVGGVTDYGRYLKLNPEEFKQEVEKSFMSYTGQYCHFYRNGKFPKSIKIRKTGSGWHLYPIWEKENSK